MTQFAELTIAGLALGAIYSLIAVGFVMVYRSSGLLNFAQGEFATLGAFLMTTFAAWAVLPWPVALLLTVLVMMAVGMGIERVIMRKLLGRPPFIGSIVTIFVGFLLSVAVLWIYGSSTRAMPTPWDPVKIVEVGGVEFTLTNLVTILVAIVLIGTLAFVMQRTPMGMAMRAVADDQEAAFALGIPVERLLGLTWGIAASLGAVAGVFLAMFPRSATVAMGLLAFRAFPAVIIGGLESPVGAIIGGSALGLLQVHGEYYVNPHLGDFGIGFHLVLAFIVMIAFLMIKPHGLFGTKELERV
ncbi:branched-chain amino acid ABC transporter permease [Nocardioides daejeonensis]|uniref:branched-chain amino acid ABC transporter permease n=1 Tax=Nocardioides daejeonensis TaxID=1046556 RepID=UPI000D7412D7|nr:branched-chain amino acid ABC transporter permease [Nocardioides daejeonensis]